MTTIAELHATYVRETGISLALSADRMAAWQRWQSRGWDARQLQGVIREINRGISKQERMPGALRFANLIGSPDKFEEELGLARAAYRRRNGRKRPVVPAGKAEVLRNTGRPENAIHSETGRMVTPPEPEARAVKDVDWRKIAAEMRKAANGEGGQDVGGE